MPQQQQSGVWTRPGEGCCQSMWQTQIWGGEGKDAIVNYPKPQQWLQERT